MTIKEMDRLTAHFNRYFKQSDCRVLHATDGLLPHIDVLVYPPNATYPFWKLATMGASDYKMPAPKQALGNRNEYMMFVDASEDLTDPAVVRWYYTMLRGIASYPTEARSFVSYGHSVEWGEEDDTDIVGAFIEMPQIIEDVGVLRCKLGLLKQTVCLQVVLLTQNEMNQMQTIGREAFSEYLYPEDGSRPHFLCQRYRTELF